MFRPTLLCSLLALSPLCPAQSVLSSVDATPLVRRIDLATGASAPAFTVDLPGSVVLDVLSLARHPGTGELYALLDVGSVTSRTLVRLDDTSGVAEVVGTTSGFLSEIEFLGGRLFGANRRIGSPPTVVLSARIRELDPATGAMLDALFFTPNGENWPTLGYDTARGELFLVWGEGVQNVDEQAAVVDFGGTASRSITLSGGDANRLDGMCFVPELDRFVVASIGGPGGDALWTLTRDGALLELFDLDHVSGALVTDRPRFPEVLAARADSPDVHRIDPNNGQDLGVEFTLTIPGATVLGCDALARSPRTGEFVALIRAAGSADQILCEVDEATGECAPRAVYSEPFAALTFVEQSGVGFDLFAVRAASAASQPESLFFLEPSGFETLYEARTPVGEDPALGFHHATAELYLATGDGALNVDEVLFAQDTANGVASAVAYSGEDGGRIRSLCFLRAANAFLFCTQDSLGSMTDSGARRVLAPTPGFLPSALAPTRAPNATCASPAELRIGTTIGRMTGAVESGGASCVTLFGSGADLWYRFTAPANGRLIVTNCESDRMGSPWESTPTNLALFADGCPFPLLLECETPVTCADGSTAGTLEASMSAGSSILIRVRKRSALSGADGSFLLHTEFNVNNDNCNSAIPLAADTTYEGSLTSTSPDGTGACTSGGFWRDVWFSYTAEESGGLTVTTCGTHDLGGIDTGMDTALALYSGCPGNATTEILCNDDPSGGFVVNCTGGSDQGVLADARVSLVMDVGETVLIRVSGNFAGATDTFFVNTTFNPFFTDHCNGDGGDQLGCTDCACGNETPQGTVGGCLNSSGESARLLASGGLSIAVGSTRFEVSGATPSSFAVLTSGAELAPQNAANPCFGLGSGITSLVLDGLRCAVQSTQRHGGRPVAADGTVGDSTNGWGPPSGPAGGLGLQGGFGPGQTRHFQVFYRELPGQVCGTEQNTTQAVEMTFFP